MVAAQTHAEDGRGTTDPSLPPVAILPLAALAWWGVGFLPWLVAGLTSGGVPMPGGRTALPLAPAHLQMLATGALFGGLVSGSLGLLAPAERRRRGLVVALVGVVLSVAVTLWHSWSTVRRGAGGAFAADTLVLAGLVAAVVACAMAGWAVAALTAAGRVGGALALAVAAGVLPFHLTAVVAGLPWVDRLPSAVGVIGSWLAGGVLAVALAVAGRHPWSRLAWWPVVLLVAWMVGPLLTAAGWLTAVLRPGMSLPGSLPDSLRGAVQVVGEASSPSNRVVLPWVFAVVLGVVLTVLARHRRQHGLIDPA